ncbi:MAG: cupredoxin domain-containing protein [Deltaproteobacteria bacterium]|nr:cupredoxin domain-containing protein [Deltaproteobacteria bacterium]
MSSRQNLSIALLGVLALAGTAYADGKAKPAEKAADSKQAAKPADAKPAAKPADARHVKVGVTEAGFEPSEIRAKNGESLVLDITRVTDETCATAIVIPDQKVRVELPLNKEVAVPVKASKVGRIAFACPMNMVTGAVVVTE